MCYSSQHLSLFITNDHGAKKICGLVHASRISGPKQDQCQSDQKGILRTPAKIYSQDNITHAITTITIYLSLGKGLPHVV